ncbi:MAG: nucleotidyltransferase domain-containing protein [Pseudomonadota bacterium]
MIDVDNIVKRLAEYFSLKDEIVMAFLFGSVSKARTHSESDMDIAVYFRRELSDAMESAIWADVEKIAGINVDFVVLNRAFPFIADSALKGMPIVIKDRRVYLKFLLRTVSEAIDYQAFLESCWHLKQRRGNVD